MIIKRLLTQIVRVNIDFDATFVNTLLNKYYSDSIVQGVGNDVLIHPASFKDSFWAGRLGGVAFPPQSQRIFKTKAIFQATG